METTPMSADRQMDKEAGVYMYNAIYSTLKKQGNPATWNNVDGPGGGYVC